MNPVKLAVAGLGRIGVMHAANALQIAQENPASCQVTAYVDADLARARAAAPAGVRVFGSIAELLGSGAANAAVVCTPTEVHAEHAGALIRAGYRVLLEKPMTESLEKDRVFAAELDARYPHALMLAFQRRFDAPLRYVKELIDQGVIGRVFKITSILEDSGPAPAGYRSGGLLQDMSVHNVDEILWLTGQMPVRAASGGSKLFSHRLRASEDVFDDGFLWLWFENELLGHIQVSRNHVSGYRIETWVFGEEGQIHMGRFEQNTREVVVEAYGRHQAIVRRAFPMPDYGAGVPEFVPRFGPAYLEEMRTFVKHCAAGTPFPVSHHDGIRAMEVIEAALVCQLTEAGATAVT
jgi:myo-inositol 2-dehydrogenase/D-chiro-inositol 1-dehydrogenase